MGDAGSRSNVAGAFAGGPQPDTPPYPDVHAVYSRNDLPAGTTVPITRGQVTKVRVEIPPDIETRIRELVDSAPDPDKFEAALAPLRFEYSRATAPPPLESPFLTLANVSVVGAQPLPPADSDPATAESAQ